MIAKNLITILLLLVGSPIIQANPPLKQTVIGIVVAHDDGLELADGSCRAMAIVRVRSHLKRKQISKYLLIRYQYPCATGLPNEVFDGKRQWHLSVTRQMNCDQSHEDLKYLVQISPDGTVSQIPLLKPVPGKESEKIPTDVKLPCYVLLPSDLKID